MPEEKLIQLPEMVLAFEKKLVERIDFMKKLREVNLLNQEYCLAADKQAQIKAYNYMLSLIELERR